MEHDTNNLRVRDVYSYIDKMTQMVEDNGLQLVLPNKYYFRRTQTKAPQTCSWCKNTIGSNKEHFYINDVVREGEPAVRMHMGRCLQEYLTEMLNKAHKIFGNNVDKRWEELVYYNGKPRR